MKKTKKKSRGTFSFIVAILALAAVIANAIIACCVTDLVTTSTIRFIFRLALPTLTFIYVWVLAGEIESRNLRGNLKMLVAVVIFGFLSWLAWWG